MKQIYLFQMTGILFDPKNGFKYFSPQVSDSGMVECRGVSRNGFTQSLHFEISVHRKLFYLKFYKRVAQYISLAILIYSDRLYSS